MKRMVWMLLLFSPCLWAQSETAPEVKEEETAPVEKQAVEKHEEEKSEDGNHKFDIDIFGYGEMRFSYFNYGANQNLPGGSQPAHRGELDLTRFVLGLEGEMPADMEFEAEIEFEHGGTGTEMELEYEEFGEFDKEIDKGGEILLEELYLKKEFGKIWSAKIGYQYVDFGLISDEYTQYYLPTSMVARGRPEGESTLIPAQWSEMGLGVEARYPSIRGVFQIVNGLDSTGFSSQQWIALGHQQRFEFIQATNVAFNARLDYTGIEGFVFGGSFYYAPNVNSNRPKDDIQGIRSAIYLGDIHAVWDWKNIRFRSLAMAGHVSNAQTISDKNKPLSNNLDVLRSPVADNAIATWAELGWNIASYMHVGSDHRIEPHVRFEYYDTIFKSRASLFDNPRFERKVYTAGLGYVFHDVVAARLDYFMRTLGSSAFRKEQGVELNVGFVF